MGTKAEYEDWEAPPDEAEFPPLPPDRPQAPKACPNCGHSQIRRIAYGYPSFEMRNDPTIELGGCVIDSDSPQWMCPSCGNRWGRRALHGWIR